MAASALETNVGALISLTPPAEGGNVWEAKQIETQRAPIPFPGEPRGRVNIDWGFGPVKVLGYIDTSTFNLTITISVLGINLGTIAGNLKDGVIINVNIALAKGSLRFYLKNGNELWVHIDIKVLFDGSFTGDYKIITF